MRLALGDMTDRAYVGEKTDCLKNGQVGLRNTNAKPCTVRRDAPLSIKKSGYIFPCHKESISEQRRKWYGEQPKSFTHLKELNTRAKYPHILKRSKEKGKKQSI
jgi:hypothetical protein